MSAITRPGCSGLPACSSPAFDVSVSSGAIDAEVRRRLRAGEPLYHVNAELIHELRPDLLITQAHCEVCAVTPGDVERSGAGAPATRQLALSASSLDDIFESILAISKALGLDQRGETRGPKRTTARGHRPGARRAHSAARRWSHWSGPIRYSPWATGVRSWSKSPTASLCWGVKANTRRRFRPSSFGVPIRSS